MQVLSKRKTLYYEAVKQGYSVSEGELQTLLDELKQSLKAAENEAEIRDFMQAFGNIDNYFNSTKEEYREGFVINKYVIDCQKKFAEENELTLEDEGFNQLWLDYYNELVGRLVVEENIVVQ